MRRASNRRRAMTLVELLVVIGIVAVLMSIVLSAVGHVRRQARSVQCLSNLGQLAHAYQLYISQNDGLGLYYMHDLRPHDGRGFWFRELRPLYGNSDSVRTCPEAVDSAGGWGGASLAWGPMDWTDNRTGAYGFNGWNHRIRDAHGADVAFSGGSIDAYVRFTSRHSAQVPLFGDCAWMDGWPRDTDPAPQNLTDGDKQNQGTPPKENMMARFGIARHGKSVNLVYLDGHAANVLLPDLWRQQWNEKFVPKDVTLPRQ